jgi:hypothetical protein
LAACSVEPLAVATFAAKTSACGAVHESFAGGGVGAAVTTSSWNGPEVCAAESTHTT